MVDKNGVVQTTEFQEATYKLLNIIHEDNLTICRSNEVKEKTKNKIDKINKFLVKVFKKGGILDNLKYYLGNYYIYQPVDDPRKAFFVLHLLPGLSEEQKQAIIKLPWPDSYKEQERKELEAKFVREGTTFRCVPKFYGKLTTDNSNIKFCEWEINKQYIYITNSEVSCFRELWLDPDPISNCENSKKICDIDNKCAEDIIKKIVTAKCTDESFDQHSRLRCCFEFDDSYGPHSLLIMPINAINDMDAKKSSKNQNDNDRVVFFSAEFNKDLAETEILELRKFLSVLINYSLSTVYYQESLKKQRETLLKHGSRAAMTAIMSRNLSHNIGSHVLSYWINKDLQNRVQDNPQTDDEKLISESKNLLRYIQQRMDFLAEVCTSVPASEVSLDFRRDIIVPIVGEGNDRGLVPLMKYLTHSEGIALNTSSFDYDIDPDCRRVSIPNGAVGAHAVYSILENFMRNAAKHYKSGNKSEEWPTLDWSTTQDIDDELITYFNNTMQERNRRLRLREGPVFYGPKSEVEEVGQIRGNKPEATLDDIMSCLPNNTHNNSSLKIKLHLKRPSVAHLANTEDIRYDADVTEGKNIFIWNKNTHELELKGFRKLTEGQEEELKKAINDEEDKKKLTKLLNWRKRYIEFRIWDMRKNSCDVDLLNDLKAYYCNLKDDNSGFIDEDGKLVHHGWGFKEMMVAANFLRKRDSEELLKPVDKNEPPVMEILCGDKVIYEDEDQHCMEECPCCGNHPSCKHSNHDEHNGKLGFRFYLRRPLHLAVLDDSVTIKDDKFFEIEKTSPTDSNTPRLTEEIPHSMLLVRTDEDLKRYTEDPRAPVRIVLDKQQNHQITDDYYLEMFKAFIKAVIVREHTTPLPKFIFTGGGTGTTTYEDLFKSLNDYGRSVPDKQDTAFDFSNLQESSIVLYHHFEDILKKNSLNLLSSKNPSAIIPLSGNWPLLGRCKDATRLDQKLREHFLLELIEACLTRVIIVDERVSDIAKESFYSNTLNGEMWSWMNVHAIDIKNREHVDYDGLLEKLSSIEVITPTPSTIDIVDGVNGKAPYVFIIHQGILDKLDGRGEELMNIVSCRWKIIDSGRGVPDDIKDYPDARFIEISHLLKIIMNFDKHNLVQTLFASRRPSE